MIRPKANELKDFIDYSISKGIAKEQVKGLLIENGWPKDVVENMFVKHKVGEDKIPPTGKNILRVANVTKAFGKNHVLDNVCLAIRPGEIFGVIGLSGSGKTTLLNTIIGFVDVDEGDVIIKSPKDKKDYLISKQPDSVRQFFGFAAQHPSFYGQLTVKENIEHFASLYSIPKKEGVERCMALIGMVGLESAKNVLAENLSGGMQKRLDIACALVHNPHVLILDEPTSDLDPVSREYMWELIKQINASGTTVILASHFVNELEMLCSRFAILHNKRIMEVGTPEELRSSYSKNYEINLEVVSGKYERIIKSLKSKKALQVQKMNINNKILTIFTPKAEHTLYHIAKLIEQSNEKIIDITVNKPTVKELFESVVKK